jgi:hypothetical protein
MMAVEILSWGVLILIIINVLVAIIYGGEAIELSDMQKIEKDIITRAGTRAGWKTLSAEEKRIFRRVKWKESKGSLLILLIIFFIFMGVSVLFQN